MSDTPRVSALRTKHYALTGYSMEDAIRKAYIEMADLAAGLERELTEARIKLTVSLNMHHRNLVDATNAHRADQGHVCVSRQTVEGIIHRILEATKAKA